MTSISKPNTFTAGTSASASEVNDNFDTIYNDYNGGISSVNLANNAVTTAKITDGNVTTAKIADGNVTTAKIADDAVTSAKLNPSKTTDANGWTVYDHGTWKEYMLVQTGDPPSIAAGAGYTGPTPTLPVGVSYSDVNVTVSGYCSFREIYFTRTSDSSLGWGLQNYYTSALNPTYYYVTWRLITK